MICFHARRLHRRYGLVLPAEAMASVALFAYVFVVGAPKASPGSRVAVAGIPLPPARVRGVGAPRRVDAVRLEQRPARHHHGRLLQERGIHEGTSGQQAAAPSAIRKDAGVSRSSSSYKVDWHARYLAEHRHVQRLLHQLARVRTVQAHETPQETIRRVFGTHGDEAVRVAYCETGGTFNPAATNGQYRGIFQMGSRERATYGDAGDVEGQARAAYRYFAAAGGWEPWACKP